ncbi:MAG: metal-transporting ATPase, partial [Christensenellaceae bacterium]
FLGMIAVADVVKEDSPEAISELKNMGIRVIMLTGDNERTARAIGDRAGVDDVIAGVLPDGKEEQIRKLKADGAKVMMVGDGINDAPALIGADVGVAIGAGTDVAIDAASVVLVQSRLLDVPAAIRLSRATLRNIKENLFWAFFYNAICIPVAAGAFVGVGFTMSPMLGAAAMGLSSFFVVSNALRLNFFRLRNTKHDKKINRNKEVDPLMKTMKIDGMMCSHCEARVKKALESLETVASAEVSHKKGCAVVSLKSETDDGVLIQAVQDAGYEVISVK